MEPRVDISRMGLSAFTYAIGTDTATGRSVATPPGSACGTLEFGSLESCLADLGEALGPYFQCVDLRFDGASMGSCSTHTLCHAAHTLAERILHMV